MTPKICRKANKQTNISGYVCHTDVFNQFMRFHDSFLFWHTMNVTVMNVYGGFD